ncbi:hypothetical protein DAERI_390002 [Deinococcus aerius]|uniref:Uncharacterized protein n=1 Tax=Deinococcus aerius TaxID=200253 RepID=A0A2I9DNS4_9DEIO|nr:hypothetical protein [Deinococcus aerius]GBF08268.1 hypothetical protein DAERI_390002 [Deinococcus aerius]
MKPPDESHDPRTPELREEPLDWRGLALLIGSYAAALLLAGLLVLLLAHLFL